MDIHSVRQQLRMKSIYDIPLRVTYYARVSSESDEQLNSLENQIHYYEDLIRKNAAWTFVPGYIDEGLSGISTKKRENFNRMVDDATEDKFDLIITKEISGFARNTLDSIQYTRQLLSSGVGVFFQNDNINTFDEDSELRLSIMSSIAQEELRKLSSRVKFGHQQAIKQNVVLGNSRIFGYRKDQKRLVIDETEAPMVRELFEALQDTKEAADAMVAEYVRLYNELTRHGALPQKIEQQQKIIDMANRKKSKLLQLVADDSVTHADFKSMTVACNEEIRIAEAEIRELEHSTLEGEGFRRRIDDIKRVLTNAQHDAATGIITKEFVDKYIDKIFVTPAGDNTLLLQIKIFAGETTEKYLRKFESRVGIITGEVADQPQNPSPATLHSPAVSTGHTFKKMCTIRTANYPRAARTAVGHEVRVRYIAGVVVRAAAHQPPPCGLRRYLLFSLSEI